MKNAIASALLIIASCAPVKDQSEAEPMAAEDLSDLEPMRAALADKLMSQHVAGGYVVPTPRMFDKDSLAFGGAMLSALPCAQGEVLLEGLETTQDALDGALVRIYPFGGDMVETGDMLSRDGVIAAAYGLLAMHQRCPELADRAARVWWRFVEFVGEIRSPRQMYPGAAKSTITPTLAYFLDFASHKMLGHASPSRASENIWMFGSIGSLADILKDKDSCYPVRLQLLQRIALQRAGRVPEDKEIWCERTASMDIPSADWYCGRRTARSWLESYEPTVWAHRNQRCGAWETPDGKPGVDHGAVDWLELYDMASGH